MTLRRILAAVDGSREAEAALRQAVALAREHRAQLTLLTVVPLRRCVGAVGTAGAPDLTDPHAAVLRAAAATVPGDVGVVTRIERGEASQAILRVAHEGAHDVIVMGRRARGRADRRALCGSVSDRVLRGAAIPVLLTPGAPQQPAPPESRAPAPAALRQRARVGSPA